MPKTVTQYSVLIASPSDVLNERRVIRHVIHDWNASAGLTRSINLAPVMWETHATPEMGDRPQAIINKQLVEDCDILVGVLWTKMGSPTGVADSGTAEEINIFMQAEKPALIYFSSAPINPDQINLEQCQRLRNFKSELRGRALLGEFNTVDELRIKLHADLTRVVDRLYQQAVSEAAKVVDTPPVPEAEDEHPGDIGVDVADQTHSRVPFEELTKAERDYYLCKAVKYYMDRGMEKIPPLALISVATGLYREETRTVEDLRREFLTSQREAMRQERKSDDIGKATSRLPRRGNK